MEPKTAPRSGRDTGRKPDIFMSRSDLLSMMTEKIPEMPNKARRVTEWLASNMSEAAFKSIGDAASELDVSKAQLVRVARALGFAGWSELKDAIQRSLLDEVNPAAILTRTAEMSGDVSLDILRTEHANIDETWARLSKDKVAKFCDMTREATINALAGLEISSLVMELAYTRYCFMGLPTILMKRGSLSLIEQARTLGKGALMVVCEIPSYSVDATEAAAEAKASGAKLVTITDSPAAPVCRHADLEFSFSVASTTFGGSIIGAVFLIHILTSALAANLGEPVRAAIEKQAAYLQDDRFFHPAYGLKMQ